MSKDELRKQVSRAAASRLPMFIYFRMSFLAQEMCIHPDDKIRFDGVGTCAVSVDFENASLEEARRWWQTSSVRCTGTVRWKMSRQAFAVYEAVWAGKVPEGIDPKYPLTGVEYQNRSFDRHSFEAYAPAFLNDAIAPIEAEITRMVTRVVGLTRWRCHRTGPMALPRLGSHEWSRDGENWKPDVRPPTMTISWGPDLVVSGPRQADIEQLLNAGDDEPVSHSLLREAESLVKSNPRSAIAVGATSAEVAVKTLCSTLAPQASWLVQNIPSPPIVKMLDEYLPILLPPKVPRLDRELIDDLKSAIFLRNKLIHGIKGNVELKHFTAALTTFRDVVWLCSYFGGISWAVNRVSQRTLLAMNLKTTVDTTGWFVD